MNIPFDETLAEHSCSPFHLSEWAEMEDCSGMESVAFELTEMRQEIRGMIRGPGVCPGSWTELFEKTKASL